MQDVPHKLKHPGNGILLSHLVAVSEKNEIGKNNQLLWHLPNDLSYFKNKTWGMAVIMGRKTYESVDKPLPGRVNIIVTSNPEWKAPGVTVTSNIQDALEKAVATDCKEIFIIGGGQIFKETLHIVDRVYLTRVHATFDGDVFYPALDYNEWEMISNVDYPTDEKHQYPYSFQVWERTGHR